MKILIAQKLGESGLKILRNQKRHTFDYYQALKTEDLFPLIAKYDALIVRSQPQLNRPILLMGQNLKVIGRAGVGLDNIDLKAASELQIEVVNSADANIISAAEHTFALIMAVSRNLVSAHQSLQKGIWNRELFIGTELYAKTLGLIGCGRIATHVAQIAKGFGLKIIGYDPYLTPESAQEKGICKKEKIDEVLQKADIISLHVQKTSETTNLLTEKELQKMKSSAILINCARGGVVNESDLYAALLQKKIAGAGIDVWETEPDTTNPLQKLSNVVATPHLGALTQEAQERVSESIVQKVLEKLELHN